MGRISLVIFVWLFAFTMVVAQLPKKSLTNADIIAMLEAGLSESTIILAIQQSDAVFDKSPQALIQLKSKGASSKVLDAILESQVRPSPTSDSTDNQIAKTIWPKQDYRLFTFEITECSLFGTRLTCELLVTNHDKDKELEIFTKNYDVATRIIDAAGTEFQASNVQFGGREATTTVVSEVPVKLTILFDNLPQSTNSLRLFEIFGTFEKKHWRENPSVQFRNVPVIVKTPSTDSKIRVVYAREFSFELISCRWVGRSVVCALNVKNNGKAESQLALAVTCSSEKSRMMDDQGNEYTSAQGSVGKSTATGEFLTRCSAKSSLSPNTAAEITVKFDNVALNATTIKLLRLNTGSDHAFGDIVNQMLVDFRDVALLK